MSDTLCRGNEEMISYILRGGGLHIRSMWARRDSNPVVLFRVCSAREAINTWFYCLAGGQYRDLTSDGPAENKAIDQVANNEGIHRTGTDPRLAVLAQLKLGGMNVRMEAPKREVVEYSLTPATQFANKDSTIIKVRFNSAFSVPGSGLSFEGGGGTLLQIGTPLSLVEILPGLQQLAFPDKPDFLG
jgi:hypothetical protein